MGYRELHRMEIEEVVRRWQMKESQRAIARTTGLARETVKKYLAAAISLGLSATGPPPSEAQLLELRLRRPRRLTRAPTAGSALRAVDLLAHGRHGGRVRHDGR